MEEQQPRTIADPQLGEFVLNEDGIHYNGTIRIEDRDIPVSLEAEECILMLGYISTTDFLDMEQLVSRAKQYAAEELLENANEWGYDAWANDLLASAGDSLAGAGEQPKGASEQPKTEAEFEEWLKATRPGEEYIPMTEDDFIRRISLESITIQDEGEYLLWFNDGDIFWGHTICVIGMVATGFMDAQIYG